MASVGRVQPLPLGGSQAWELPEMVEPGHEEVGFCGRAQGEGFLLGTCQRCVVTLCTGDPLRAVSKPQSSRGLCTGSQGLGGPQSGRPC